MFITNNSALFHLWWKANLVKHQRGLKYYENNCRSPRLLLMEYSNSVMSCDGISIDWFLLLFLHSTCDYSYFIAALYNVLLDYQTAWRWAEVFCPKLHAIKKHKWLVQKLNKVVIFYFFNFFWIPIFIILIST